MLAAAARGVLLALGALPFGAGLPHAATWTCGLVPAAVLDGAGPREGLARGRRAPRAHAAAQALPWLVLPAVWLNLAVAYGALLTWLVRIDPGHLEAALRDGPALGVLAGLAWWLVDPLRAAASVAAHGAWREQVQGGDLVRAARGMLLVALLLGLPTGAAQAEPLSPEAWSAYVWEAREAVLSGETDAADQVLTLLGREVQVGGGRAVMVTDPTLARLSERLAGGDGDAVVDTVHHLVVLERLARQLGRAGPLSASWTPPPGRTPAQGDARPGELRSSLEAMGTGAGRLQAWATGGDATAPEVLGGRGLVFTGLVAVACGLGWLLWASRGLEHGRVWARAGGASPAVAAPQAAQGTARAAVRQGYVDTLEALERSGRVDGVAHLTNGQVGERLHGTLWERFRRATQAYEATWYGTQPAGEPELLAVEEALAGARERPS